MRVSRRLVWFAGPMALGALANYAGGVKAVGFVIAAWIIGYVDGRIITPWCMGKNLR